MTSLGEADIMVRERICGKARVLDLSHQALAPRLRMTLGVTLIESDGPLPGLSEVQMFELRDLLGELRLSENGDALATLFWTGPRRFVRSATFASESQLPVTCELEPWKLEVIEEQRAGAPPTFFLALWPTLVAGGTFLDAEVRAIRVTIPRDVWLDYLGRARRERFEVLEIPLPATVAPELSLSFEMLRKARAAVDRGEFDQALIFCRQALEASREHLPRPEDKREEAASYFLKSVLSEDHSEQYARIIGASKKLMNRPAHLQSEPAPFTRSEANFVIGVTASVLGLVGWQLGARS